MNIRRGLLTCSFLTVTLIGYCQNPGLGWIGVFDGDNTKSLTQVATDNAGNVYTVGLFYGTFDVDPTDEDQILTSEDGGDGFILKQNSDGEFQWAVALQGTGQQSAYTVNVAADGNIVVSGYFEETVDFDPGAGVTSFTVANSTAFLMKLTPAGNLVWAKAFISPDGTSYIGGVATDVQNNIFIGGQFLGTVDADPSSATVNLVSNGNNDVWFAKFGGAGNFISAVSAGGTGEDNVDVMTIDHNNEIIAGGVFQGGVDFDPGSGVSTLTSNGGDDEFIMKLSNTLGFVWARQIVGDEVYLGQMATDASNNVIFNGTFYQNADFDPGSGQATLIGVDGDFFITSWNASGNYNWAKRAGATGSLQQGDALTVDAAGNIYVAGQYAQQFDINPDNAVEELIQYEEPGWDMYVAKFSNTGDLVWYQPIPSTDIITPSYMNVDVNNNIYIIGDWNEHVNFSFSTCVDGERETHDNALGFLLKIIPNANNTCFGFLEQPIASQEGCQMQNIYFSAPAGGAFHINYQWQMLNGGTWHDLDDQEFDGENNDNGYYGTHTAYLVITPVEGGTTGDVRLMVSGDGVTTIYSNVAHFIVNTPPPLPVLTATSGCGPGYYMATASGTTYGKYLWYVDEELMPNDTTETFSYYYNENTDVEVAIEENGCGGQTSHVTINTHHCSQPPGLEWAQQISAGFLKPVAMTIDSNNDVYIAGQFTSKVDFNLGVGVFEMTPNGTDDYFVAKYSSSGTFFWARQTDMTIFDISTGGAADVYYVGNFQGTVDFDPGAGTFNMSVTGAGRDMAMVELAGDGTFEWAKQFTGTTDESGNIIRAVTDASSGEIIITGSFTRTVDFDPGPGNASLTSASTGGPDIFVAKYDEDGNYMWAKRMGSTAFVERGLDVEVDDDGYIYTVGVFQTTVDFDPGAGAPNVHNLTSAGQTDAFIQCLNPDGTYRWADRVGGTTADEAVGISLDHSDHPVVVGHFTGTADFDPGAGVANLVGGSQTSFILKLTDLGAFEWAGKTGGEISKVFVDPTDKITLTGFFEHSIDLDPGADEYRLETAVTSDIFVSQLDPSGSFLWAYNTNASGLGSFQNEPVGVAMDNAGSLYVVGWFTKVIDVDPTNCVYALIAEEQSRQIFIQKVKPNLASLCFSLEPKTVAGCAGGGQIHLTAEAVGTTNINYQWQILNTAFGYFENITAQAGYTGINTNELIIDATPTFGKGLYRVFVTGDNASSNYSDPATVKIDTKPDPPTIIPVSFCSPGAKTLLLTGDNDGYYKWYDENTNEISGAVDHDFVTPFLTSTTTFYATELNGACESDFAQFDAVINISIDEPIGIDASSCSAPASVTLKADSEAGGEFRWYENPEDEDPVTANTTGSFKTPELSSTKSYYVAVSDGTCESLRTEVVAHIGNVNAPGVDDVTVCTNETTTIEATAGSSGEVRWYESATATSPIHTGTTFVTPSLATSTTYYVSYFETACESIRIPVTVNVNSCGSNQPPLIAAVSPSTSSGNVLTVPLNLSDPDDNLDLSTLKIITQPKSTALATINQNHELVIDYTGLAFVGEDELVVEVCDLAGSCFQRTIKVTVTFDGETRIYNAVSPNNDGKNDVFYIANVGLVATKDNHVWIYNRWGDLVYDVENYDNVNRVFAGISNGGKELQSGTYFYKVEFSGKETETGYLVLKR